MGPAQRQGTDEQMNRRTDEQMNGTEELKNRTEEFSTINDQKIR